MLLLIGSTRATGPAKFVLTEAAGHMITALVLFNLCTTHRTEGNIASINVDPTL